VSSIQTLYPASINICLFLLKLFRGQAGPRYFYPFSGIMYPSAIVRQMVTLDPNYDEDISAAFTTDTVTNDQLCVLEVTWLSGLVFWYRRECWNFSTGLCICGIIISVRMFLTVSVLAWDASRDGIFRLILSEQINYIIRTDKLFLYDYDAKREGIQQYWRLMIVASQ